VIELKIRFLQVSQKRKHARNKALIFCYSNVST